MDDRISSDTDTADLRARIVAAALEVSHLTAIATHHTTRAELGIVQQLLDAAGARMADATAPGMADTVEKVLEVARRRLQAVHEALADGGRDASI